MGHRLSTIPGTRLMSADLIERTTPASDSFELENYPFYLMARVTGHYNEALRQVLKRIGMDQPRWRVLMILGHASPSSISQIAEMGVIKLSTITRIVQRMQKDGLVSSTSRPQDHRITDVSLTQEGARMLLRVRKVASNVFRQAIGTLNSEQLKQFNATLNEIERNLTRSPYDEDIKG